VRLLEIELRGWLHESNDSSRSRAVIPSTAPGQGSE
jgi:hypothetical protein